MADEHKRLQSWLPRDKAAEATSGIGRVEIDQIIKSSNQREMYAANRVLDVHSVTRGAGAEQPSC